MKPAEEWLAERLDGKHGEHEPQSTEVWDKLHIQLYKQIQLDAFKAGAEWAAEICKERSEQCFSPTVASHHKQDEQAILTAAKNLTELPK